MFVDIMPQLSVYIDEDTLSKLESGAKRDNISVSKFVVAAVNEHLSNSWHERLRDLYGCIDDETFTAKECAITIYRDKNN
jgi:hypothetical protein